MVQEVNRQYHIVSKFVMAFLQDVNMEPEVVEQLVTAWKAKRNKLKTLIQKGTVAAPKRVISKYLYFCQEVRPQIRAEFPGIKIREATCELGKRWQNFLSNPDPEQMARYQKLFDIDKERYDAEKSAIVKPEKRRAPNSAYMAFCAEQRSQTPKIDIKELAKMWNIVKRDANQFAKYKALVVKN